MAFVRRMLSLIPVVLLLGAVAYAVLTTPKSITKQIARGERPLAPEFRLPRFDGGLLALVDLRGRAVVLNFWASWCGPCKEEAPHLERAWREYRNRGLVVVGVNVQDLDREARKFLAVTGATFPNVRDGDNSTYRAYGLTGVPETFFIDRRGRIVRKFPGAYTNWPIWQDAIEGLLREP